MEIIPKAGIVVGTISVCVFLPLWATVTIAENEFLFAKVFFDKNLHLEKMEQAESYKVMLERYPDAVITSRTHAMHGSDIEMIACGGDNSQNGLRVDIHYNQMGNYLHENARCHIRESGDRKNIGTMPPEIPEGSPIPKSMLTNGDALDGLVPEFVKHTNCIELKAEPEEMGLLEADYHIAIPENTGVPGCQENLSRFEPYSLKIKTGDVASFRNFDSEFHTDTSVSPEFGPTGEFDSELMEEGDQFLRKFTGADQCNYFCMVHPWQTGKITVHEK